jgi:hypothetical protein
VHAKWRQSECGGEDGDADTRERGLGESAQCTYLGLVRSAMHGLAREFAFGKDRQRLGLTGAIAQTWER